MDTSNVRPIEDEITPLMSVVPEATAAPATPRDAGPSSAVDAAHPGDMSGTFNPDPPFWRSIGHRGQLDGWRDRTL